jgi:hypothetical protein
MSKPILKAVTLCKCGDLQYRAYELLIQDGKVIGKRAVDRGAGDVAQIQIGRLETTLWSYKDEQAEEAVSKLKDM